MRARRAHPLQLEMQPVVDAPVRKPTWGGRRAGAGRKKTARGPQHVPHRRRAKHAKSRPVHITMRARKGLPSFRAEAIYKMMLLILARQRKPSRKYARDFHVVHFSIQSNHLHVIAEASDVKTLRSGVSGLVIAFAKRLARLFDRTKLKVWAERYHSRELGSPREVRNALVYVLNNFQKHGHTVHGDGIVDRYSSATSFDHWQSPVIVATPLRLDEPRGLPNPPWRPAEPRTWLLGRGWSDHHPRLVMSERPA